MRIKIVSKNQYELIAPPFPVVGTIYALEEDEDGSDNQNRAFHSLLEVYYISGLWSYQGSGYKQGATLEEFKKLIKRKLGCGFESFVYVDIINGSPKLFNVQKYSDVPEHVRNDPDKANYIYGHLKSWRDYTKKERRDTMDKLISEMHQVGVNSAKFHEILEGMAYGFKSLI